MEFATQEERDAYRAEAYSNARREGLSHADASARADDEAGPWIEPVAKAPAQAAPAASIEEPASPVADSPVDASSDRGVSGAAETSDAESVALPKRATRTVNVTEVEERIVPKEASASGEQGSFAVALGLVAVGAAYCVAELSYNLSLVEFVSSANTSAAALENLERVGKGLAAFGLANVLVKLLGGAAKSLAGASSSVTIKAAARMLSGARALALFVTLCPLAYWAISSGFDAAVANLPHAAKVEGYYLGAYRTLVLEGSLADPDLAAASSQRIQDKLLLVNLPLAAGAGKDPQTRVVNFVYGDDNASFDKEIALLWEVYDSVANRIDPLWSYYAIESRKAGNQKGLYGELYAKEFAKRTGGIPPGLSKEAFNAEVQKRYPALETYRQSVVIPAQPAIGMPALRMGDIQSGLDQAGFSKFIQKHIDDAKAGSRAKAEKVEELAHSTGLIGSAFIPPMSMTLSLMSFGMNAALLAGGIVGLLLWPLARFPAARALAKASNVCFVALALGWIFTQSGGFSGEPARWQAKVAGQGMFSALWARAIDGEAAVLRIASPALPAIHSAFIDDTHPGEVKRVKVEKAAQVDMSEIDARLEQMKASSAEAAVPAIADPNFVADEKRINDPTYFGESRAAGGNPYVKKK